MKNKQAFTLVELIVVITILAVLGTIAFLSFQSYTVYARDVVRLSNLKNIESGLQIQYTQGGNYAVPDDFVNITASGTIIRQQGVFGTNALRTIRANTDASKDPLTEQYYDYVTDAYQSEYQLVGYMESDEAMNVGYESIRTLLQGTHASGTGFIMKTLGQDMGIVSKDGVDLHRDSANIGQDFDIRNNSNQEYTIKFDQTDEITSTSGSLLFSNVYNRGRSLLRNKSLADLDTTLLGFWDMETPYLSGATLMLKDFSQNESHLYPIGDTEIGNVKHNGMVGIDFSLTGNSYFEHVGFGNNLDTGKITLVVVFEKNKEYEHAYQKLILIGNSSSPTGFLAGISQGPLAYPFYGIVRSDIGRVGEGYKYYPLKDEIDISALTYSQEDQFSYYINESTDFTVHDESVGYVTEGGALSSKDLPLRIGYGYGSEFFKGIIYEARVYNRILSQKEIMTIYHSTFY